MTESGLTNQYVEDLGKTLLTAKMNFLGVFPCDLQPTIKAKTFSLIFNTGDSSTAGEHFVAIFANKRTLYYFDSFGKRPTDTNINRDVVLDAHAVADHDVVAHEDALPQRAVRADARAGRDVHEVPDLRAGAQRGAVVDDGAGVGPGGGSRIVHRVFLAGLAGVVPTSPKGLRTTSRAPKRLPSCRSSLHSVRQPASSAEATIRAS